MTVLRIAEYQMRDVLRSRWAVMYGLAVLVATDLLMRFTPGSRAALLGLGSVTLLLVPLATMVFGTLYFYSARPFHEILLTQRVTRAQLITGSYLGLAVPLTLAFVIGAALPFVYFGLDATASFRAVVVVLAAGALLTLIFVGIALLVATVSRDRLRGMAIAFAVWLVITLLYDSLALLAANLFREYPLERPLIIMLLLNPVDLARVFILLDSDAAALMGYTGAILTRTLSGAGRAVALTALVPWLILPPAIAWLTFRRSDL
jgi:Cu-processing system permease protein